MKLIIDIPEDVYKKTIFYREFKDLNDCVTTIKALENGIPLDDIRAEITSLRNALEDYGQMDEVHALNFVMQIIDKYR